MFSTKSAQSLKNLFASYHEPPSLSKQQSQRLLDGLKASFRQQLDREYGRSATSPPPVHRAGDRFQRQRRSAANQHLKAILSNPLFSYTKQPSFPSMSGRDPMDVFDHAVSRGLMNLKAATGCLIAKRDQALGSSQATHSEHIIEIHGVSSRVIQWLKMTDSADRLWFLDNRGFVRALMPFLVMEDMEDIVWEWVSDALKEVPATTTGGLHFNRALLVVTELVRTKSHPRHGELDAAISAILQAEKVLPSQRLLSEVLVLPWRMVSWLSTVESYNKTAPSESLFEAHMATADRLPRRLAVEKAHLHLYHPSAPDPAPALQFFEDKNTVHNLIQAVASKTSQLAYTKGMGVLPWIAFLGHDTVDSLTQDGRSQEAQNITELLEMELPDLFANSLHLQKGANIV